MAHRSATASSDALEERLDGLFASDPDVIADPWPTWRALRESDPVIEHDSAFLVTRHADVKAILRNPRLFSSDAYRRGTHAEHYRAILDDRQWRAFEEMHAFLALMMVETDDPEHERLRRIVHRAFTPRRIAELEAATSRYVDEIIAEIADDGEVVVDLAPLAQRVPLLIIGELLGVPREDQAQIKAWSSTWSRFKLATDDSIFKALEAQTEFRAYVEGMIEEHRRSPDPTDLVSALVGAEHDERLTQAECAAMFFTLLFGGHETTTSLIATGLQELLLRRDQWQALCDDPAIIAAAVEELVRYVTPVQWLSRRTVAEVEVGGITIPENAHVLPLLACANRDPSVFAEPDQLHIARTDAGQHVGLGFGQHFCIGASLARLEGRIVFETLARRFPTIELAADSFEWTGSAQLRKLKALPVRVHPTASAT